MAWSTKQLVGILTDVGFDAVEHGHALVAGASSFTHSHPNTVTFWKFSDPPTADKVTNLSDGVIVIAEHSTTTVFASQGIAAIGVSNPRAAFAVIGAAITPSRSASGIAPTAMVSVQAIVDPSASIGAGTIIGDESRVGAHCRVGNYCVVHPGVWIEGDVEIGDHTVIGGPGFGYVNLPSGDTIRLPHLGSVHIGRGAHIGSHVAIDRGTLDNTFIGENSRIDNLVHIAHNVHVGAGAMVIAGAEVSGGALVGDGAWIAPQASVREHVTIGEKATVGLGSVVVRDVLPGSTVAGVPARELSSEK